MSRGGRQRRRLTATEVDLAVVHQRALLVGTGAGLRTLESAEASLHELALLADTARAEPVEEILQRRDRPDPATYVGSGKAQELREAAEGLDVDVVVFDDELSPAQQRNLEKLLAVDVVDRVALILDIFAQHATSQEGMVQVELAQLRYRMPRLRGRGVELSQQAGGIGTRGPGETQLEVDRRRIQRRITKLESDLKRLAKTRSTQRKARRRSRIPRVALVGYTNAGKSTLLNRLAASDALVEDRLFSTLDPTTRRVQLPGGESLLISDTVGFVRRLPHQLVEAFRSTLDEVNEADLLVHLVDATAPDAEEQVDAVHRVLDDIGAAEIPELLVVNKTDAVDPDRIRELTGPDGVAISARTGEGIDKLLEAVGERLRALAVVTELKIPYERGDVLAALHREGEVLVEVHADDGTRVRARLGDAERAQFREYVTG
jgi:GTPase